MRNNLTIGHNELRLFLKNRAAYIWLFALPLAMIVGMSFISYGGGKASNRFPPVLIENHDTGFLGQTFIDELSAQGLWRLDPLKDTKHKPVKRIVIPADFTTRVLAKQSTHVEFLPGSASENPGNEMIVEVRMVRALVALNSYLFETTSRSGLRPDPSAAAAPPAATLPAGAEAGATPDPASPTVAQASLPATLDSASPSTWPPTAESLKALQERPDLVSLDAKYADPRQVPSGFGFSLPGNLVNFLMMNLLIFGGSTVAATRRSGVLKRLLTLPVRRGELVTGQLYGLWLLGVVQIVFFLAVGKFAFHLNLGANLPGVLLVLLVFAWVASALGVLIGSLFETPDRVVGICVLTSLLMAALGGCWFPLEFAPAAMKFASHCVPAGWALDGLHRVITFGDSFSSVLPAVAVLCGFGAVATVAAGRWFRV